MLKFKLGMAVLNMVIARRALLGAMMAGPALAQGKAPGATPVPVVASFTILADMVAQVGGGRVAVRSLAGVDQELHGFQPRPSDIQAVAQARRMVPNGLGLEGWAGTHRQVRRVQGRGGGGQPRGCGVQRPGTATGPRGTRTAMAASIPMPGRMWPMRNALCGQHPRRPGRGRSWRGGGLCGGGGALPGRRLVGAGCAGDPRLVRGHPGVAGAR